MKTRQNTAHSFFRSYSQIVISSSSKVGVFLFASTCLHPQMMLGGAIAVVVAILCSRLLSLSEEQRNLGLHSYNALLVGLGAVAWFGSTNNVLWIVLLAAIASVFVTAACRAFLGSYFALPTLTWPFLMVFYIFLAAWNSLDTQPVFEQMSLVPANLQGLPHLLHTFLTALSGIFFFSHPLVGILIFIGLLVYSRIAAVTALLICAATFALFQFVFFISSTALESVILLNVLLVTVSVSGVWFVPGLFSLLAAVLAAGFTIGLSLGLNALLSGFRLPLLILPFNLVSFLILYAMRERLSDRNPKSVDFFVGTPEQNLRYYRTRLARFGSHYQIRFHAPFMGTWYCTQGVEGAFTHKGPWKDALDFQVSGADGQMHRGQGNSLEDHLCYRLPVCAAADGTVIRVVDSVADNPIGEVNLRNNWGNLVLIYHAPRLYSLVCHLSPGSVRVKEGQVVRQGDILALCGNSGRSPVPHLHFQLQASHQIGAATLPIELHEIITVEQGLAHLHATFVPQKGTQLRNIQSSSELSFPPSFLEAYVSEFTSTNGVETVVSEFDMLNHRILMSRKKNSNLYFDKEEGMLTIYDVIGKDSSVLHALHYAMPRWPNDTTQELIWDDFVPVSIVFPKGLRWASDLLSILSSTAALSMHYRL
ncbi:MAG: urea transporter [Myxococcales bacterium]|nr:MAG: urea transporter [Myxococcales bacterium]